MALQNASDIIDAAPRCCVLTEGCHSQRCLACLLPCFTCTSAPSVLARPRERCDSFGEIDRDLTCHWWTMRDYSFSFEPPGLFATVRRCLETVVSALLRIQNTIRTPTMAGNSPCVLSAPLSFGRGTRNSNFRPWKLSCDFTQ